MLQTEFTFTLPKGYIDQDGTLHNEGVMRLASAADEIAPLQDPRVQRNEAYMSIILLSRVVTHLGTMEDINPAIVERMFAADVAYLQDLYQQINSNGHTLLTLSCPHCKQNFDLEEQELRRGKPLGE